MRRVVVGILIALSTFAAIALVLNFPNSAEADVLDSELLNGGQFRVDYLGIYPPYDGTNPGTEERTVRYAVTNQGCNSGGTTGLTLNTPTTGKGNGKGKGGDGGGGSKEPKCAGMSHFSVGVDENFPLLIPKDASGGDYDYVTSDTHPECLPPDQEFTCLVRHFSPTLGDSGATNFYGLKFSKHPDEESLPFPDTVVFQFTYEDRGSYKEGDLGVLVKPGNKSYRGTLPGPVRKP